MLVACVAVVFIIQNLVSIGRTLWITKSEFNHFWHQIFVSFNKNSELCQNCDYRAGINWFRKQRVIWKLQVIYFSESFHWKWHFHLFCPNHFAKIWGSRVPSFQNNLVISGGPSISKIFLMSHPIYFCSKV